MTNQEKKHLMYGMGAVILILLGIAGLIESIAYIEKQIFFESALALVAGVALRSLRPKIN